MIFGLNDRKLSCLTWPQSRARPQTPKFSDIQVGSTGISGLQSRPTLRSNRPGELTILVYIQYSLFMNAPFLFLCQLCRQKILQVNYKCIGTYQVGLSTGYKFYKQPGTCARVKFLASGYVYKPWLNYFLNWQ